MTTDQAVFASEEYIHGAYHAIAKYEGESQADEGDILEMISWRNENNILKEWK